MDLFDDDILYGAPAAPARPNGKFAPKNFKKPSQKKISASEQLQNMEEDTTNSIIGNPQQVSVRIDTVPLVGDLPFTTAAPEVVADQNFADFPKSASEADSVGFEVGSVTKSIPEIDLSDENELNNVASPSTTCSAIDSNKSFEVIDNSLRVSSNVGFKSASDKNNNAISESNIHSDFDFGKEREVFSAEFELHPFENFLLDPSSGSDPTYKVSMHEELKKSADCPTLADFLHQDVTGEKEDANKRKNSLRKRRRSSITGVEDGGKTSRQLRKQAALKPTNMNQDVEDDDDLDPPYNYMRDELEENDDEYEVDNSPKKKRAPTSSKKKSIAKNVKATKKHKQANDVSEKSTKEPPKKFSHSTRRRKRCVDEALLEVDKDDYGSLPLRLLISVAEHKERHTEKEAKTSSMNKSGGDLFQEADANDEEEIFGSEDGTDRNDDQLSKRIISTESLLFNYGSFSNKAPRAKWSKQETELFYMGIREFGTNFSLIKWLFPDKTCHQVKLKYKNEDRKHPLQISDAFNNPETDHSHFKLLIERLQQAFSKAEQDPCRDASEFMPGEEVEDLAPGTNMAMLLVLLHGWNKITSKEEGVIKYGK